MKRARVTYVSEQSGNGRVTVDYGQQGNVGIELYFPYQARMGLDLKRGDEVDVEVREFMGIPYIQRVIK